MSFEYPIPLAECVLKRIEELNFTESFEVQKLSAEPVFQGASCRIMAPTGSGKTLSYILPLGAKLAHDSAATVCVLASSPELASQIHSVFKDFHPDISSILLVGGANLNRQKERLKKKPRFICATPGRAYELFCLKRLKITENTTLVIDEIDSVIERRNSDKVGFIIEAAGQLIVASATYSDASLDMLAALDHSLEEILVEKREGLIKYSYVFCTNDKKEISLVKLLRQINYPPSLVFVNNIKHTSHLMKVLASEEIACAKLDSRTSKNTREQAIKDLRQGKIKLLVTSDSLARGMDFDDICVIQYGVARQLETFIHRSGRVGRAGKEGRCISLVTGDDAFLLKKYSKKMQVTIDEVKLTTPANKRRKKKTGPKKKK